MGSPRKKRRLAEISARKRCQRFDGLLHTFSWDSLHSGPDPRPVAQDIHQHSPTLTRKGTIFQAGQVTIDQRQAELISFVRALFSDDMPTLIKQIRISSVASDFLQALEIRF